MKKSVEISELLSKDVLGGIKVPHSVSQPLIYSENGYYFLAVFAFFFNNEDIKSGLVERPSLWVIANVETGDIVKRYETKEVDFSDAPYDIKYNIRSDGQYDTSQGYYDRAFGILDEVREGIIKQGVFHEDRYMEYLNMIVANIPREYQRFYYDLSVKAENNPNKKEDSKMEEVKNVSDETGVLDEKMNSPQPDNGADAEPKLVSDSVDDTAQSIKDEETKADGSEAVLCAIDISNL